MYGEVPPLHEASKVMVFPTFCVDGSVGEDVSVGIPRAGFTVTSLFMLFVVAAPGVIILIFPEFAMYA